MDLNTLYARSVEGWAERVNAVPADRWEDPTPCREWTVRDLVNHVCSEDLWTGPLVDGRTIAEVGDRFDGDLLGRDPIHVALTAATDATRAVARTLPQGGTVHLSYGDERLEEYVLQLAADHLIHGWDLAVATGGDPRLDPALVHEVATWFAEREDLYRAGADALFIQSDSLGSPYKLANIGDLLGTIDQDRMTGISGPLGPVPTSTPVTSTVTYHPTGGVARSRTGSSGVQLPGATAAVTFYEMSANHQTELDAIQPGSESQTWTVHGHTAAGPFTFSGGNRYTDTFDIASASSFDLADLVFLLTNVNGVSVDSVQVDSDVVDDTAVYKIVGAEQRRGGAWHAVGAGKPALVKAGTSATMRLRYAGGLHGPAFKLTIPARAAGMSGRLFASAVEGFPFERDFPGTLDGVKRLVKNAHRNDQAQVQFFAFGGRAKPVQGQVLTQPGSKVVTGQTSLRFRVS